MTDSLPRLAALVALAAATLAPGIAPAADFDPDARYRLTTMFEGECKSLDIVNDAHDRTPILAKTADVSGQYWRITPAGDGYYRLTTQWKGPGRSLDIVNDAHDRTPILAETADVSGQHWRITPTGDGYYRLTTQWKGPGRSLDIVNDAHDRTPILAPTADVSGQHWRIVEDSMVGPVPQSLGLHGFYDKYLDADGIPIVSSSKVPDRALYQVRFLTRQMLSKIPKVRQSLVYRNVRIAIIADDEVTRDIPEHAGVADPPGRNLDEDARGLGATLHIPVSSCAEENLLCYETTDPYNGEDIFIHEFAHTIQGVGLSLVYKDFDKELSAAFVAATRVEPLLWQKTYAGSDIQEYFAEGVQSWFSANAQAIPADDIHNHVDTRDELEAYDPKLYALLAKYFPEDDDRCTCQRAGDPSGPGVTSAPAARRKARRSLGRKHRVGPPLPR